MRRLFHAALTASAALLLLAHGASATPLALSYSIPAGGGFIETFDGMGPTGTRTPGVVNGAGWDSYWSLFLAGATPTEQYLSLGLGSANPAIDAYNGGAAGGADRALGLYTTATGNPTRNMDARYRNDTGAALAQFYVEFDIEFWLQRNVARWNGIQAFYSPNGTTWTNLGNAFEGTLLNATNTAGLVDGNAAANSIRGVGGLVDLASYGLAPIAAGSNFYLRFSSSTGLTTPAGQSINQNRNVGAFLDNLWVGSVSHATFVPEPGTSILLALGLAGLAWLGRSNEARRSPSARYAGNGMSAQ
jgi:hypothetical protein